MFSDTKYVDVRLFIQVDLSCVSDGRNGLTHGFELAKRKTKEKAEEEAEEKAEEEAEEEAEEKAEEEAEEKAEESHYL